MDMTTRLNDLKCLKHETVSKIMTLQIQYVITTMLSLLQGVPKELCPVCVAAVEEPYIQLSLFLHSYMGQAST